MSDPDHAPDLGSAGTAGHANSGGAARPTYRAITLVAGAVLAVLATLAVVALVNRSDGSGSLQSGIREVPSPDDDAVAAGGPDGGAEPPADDAGSASAEAPEGPTTTTSTTLPGVVDQGDPRAVAEALVARAAAGVVPEEATLHLTDGNPAIATELFMFAAEGIASSDVGECPISGANADSARCTVAIEASYGARTTAEMSLTRADAQEIWTVSDIRMSADPGNGDGDG